MGGCYMKYKINDRFIYTGNSYVEERNRVQIVYDMNDEIIHSKFIDGNEVNVFEIGGVYCNECMIVNQDNTYMEYKNGIPLDWRMLYEL